MQVNAGLLGTPFAVYPNVVLAPAASDPFQDRLTTVTDDPDTVSVPFHSWVMLCPLASVHRTVQPWVADPPAFTVTWPWNPPDHEFVVW